MYKWSEMSRFQKVLHVLTFVCVAAWFVLAALYVLAIWKCESLMQILLGVWCLDMGVGQKSKNLRILWFVLAAAYVVLGILDLFF